MKLSFRVKLLSNILPWIPIGEFSGLYNIHYILGPTARWCPMSPHVLNRWVSRLMLRYPGLTPVLVFIAFGAVHKVRHAIFGQFLPPPPVTLCHTSRDPSPKVRHTSRTPQIFTRSSTKTRTKAPCTNSLSIVRGGFCPGVLSGGLLSWRFCPGWFLSVPLLSECICYNRKLNITLNFMFHMQDKKIYKRDVTCSWPPSPLSQTVTLSRTPSPPRAWRTLWTAPLWAALSGLLFCNNRVLRYILFVKGG